MMRGDSATDDCVPMSMAAHFGILCYELSHELATALAAFQVRIASSVGCIRSRLVATTPCRHEDYGRQQVVMAQGSQQSCGRHFGHLDLHRLCTLYFVLGFCFLSVFGACPLLFALCP